MSYQFRGCRVAAVTREAYAAGPPSDPRASQGSATTVAARRGCCTNPRRAHWSLSKGGVEKAASRPSPAARPAQPRRCQPLSDRHSERSPGFCRRLCATATVRTESEARTSRDARISREGAATPVRERRRPRRPRLCPCYAHTGRASIRAYMPGWQRALRRSAWSPEPRFSHGPSSTPCARAARRPRRLQVRLRHAESPATGPTSRRRRG